jgi:hypothetical protein
MLRPTLWEKRASRAGSMALDKTDKADLLQKKSAILSED